MANIHYIAIAASSLVVFVFACFLRLDMEEDQQKRISWFSVLVIFFSWIDFAGDVSWTYLRFDEHSRGDVGRGCAVWGCLS